MVYVRDVPAALGFSAGLLGSEEQYRCRRRGRPASRALAAPIG
jgi:hypothetical protein